MLRRSEATQIRARFLVCLLEELGNQSGSGAVADPRDPRPHESPLPGRDPSLGYRPPGELGDAMDSNLIGRRPSPPLVPLEETDVAAGDAYRVTDAQLTEKTA